MNSDYKVFSIHPFYLVRFYSQLSSHHNHKSYLRSDNLFCHADRAIFSGIT